jgi:hypothetical protein
MSDDFVPLNVLIVSGSGSERDAMHNAASYGSAVIEIADLDRIADGNFFANRSVDVIFLDSRMAHEARQALIDAARAASSRPFVISVGLNAGAIAAEAMAFDGAIAKPLQAPEVRASLEACERLRRPSRVLVVDDSLTMGAVIRNVPPSRDRRGRRWGCCACPGGQSAFRPCDARLQYAGSRWLRHARHVPSDPPDRQGGDDHRNQRHQNGRPGAGLWRPRRAAQAVLCQGGRRHDESIVCLMQPKMS